MRPIRYNNSLAVARVVVEELMRVTQQWTPWDELSDKHSAWVEIFDNCREQGMVVKVWRQGETRHWAICEHRNRDSIRVWEYGKARHPSNLMADDGEMGDHTFGDGKAGEAAMHIMKRIVAWCKESGTDGGE